MSEVMEMTAEQIETRSAEIAEEIKTADETRLAELDNELNEIESRKMELANALEERKSEMLAVAKGAGEVIETPKEERTMSNVLETKEYIDAYADYIKTGDDKECRALLTTQVSGVVPVPVLVDEIVRTAWENDQILNRVKKTYFRGNLKVPFERSATAAVVHTEGTTAPSEEELLLGIVEMVPRNIKKWITISDEAVAMGGEAFLRYIYDELTYQIVKKIAAEVVGDIKGANTTHSGSAVGIPQKALAPSAVVFQKALTGLSDEVDVNNLVAIINPATDAAIIDAVAAANFSIDPYAGLTKIYSSALPAYSTAEDNAVYAIVGDLNGAQVNFPEGDDVVIKWDDLSLAESDLVKVVGREYAAHAVTAPGRFVNITKPAAVTT